MKHAKTRTAALLLAAIGIPISHPAMLSASATTWQGTAHNGLWSDPANWSDGVPGAQTTAILAGSGQTIDLGGTPRGAGAIVFQSASISLANGVLATSLVSTDQRFDSMTAQLTTTASRLSLESRLIYGLSIDGPIVGTGFDVELGATVTGTNMYTGRTIVAAHEGMISGNGSIRQTSSVDLAGMLTLRNTQVYTPDRLNDAATIRMFGGSLVLEGNPSSAVFERVGAIEIVTDGADFVLRPASLTGPAVKLSSPAMTPAVATSVYVSLDPRLDQRIVFDTPPSLVGDGSGPTRRGIVPFIHSNFYDNVVPLGSSLMTYDRGADPVDPADDVGLRNLELATDFESSIPLSGSPANLRLTGPANLASSATVNALLLDNSASLEIQSGTLTVASGAIHLGMNSTTSEVVTITGAGAIDIPGEAFIVSGDYARVPRSTIDVPIQADHISINGGVRLDKPNDIAGQINLHGAVRLGVEGALGTGTIHLNDSTLMFGSSQTLSNPIVFGNGSQQLEDPAILLDLEGIWCLNNSVTLSGHLGGSGYVTLWGGGTLRINGDGGFGVFTMEGLAGLVEINGTLKSSIAPDQLSIAANLRGDGAFLGVVSGGSISPGPEGGPGRLAVQTVQPGLDFIFDLDGVIPGQTYDQLVLVGGVVPSSYPGLGGLTVDLSFLPDLGQQFLIFDDQFAGSMQRAFTGLPEGAILLANGVPMQISYLGGDGNDITLTVVPEPSNLMVLGILGAGFARRRRSFRNQ